MGVYVCNFLLYYLLLCCSNKIIYIISIGTFYEKMTLVDFISSFKFINFLLGTKTLYKTALTHLKLDYPS